TQTNATTGCESSTRLMVTVIFTNVAPPVLSNLEGDQFCFTNNPTIEDLLSNIVIDSNFTYECYDDYPNGNLLTIDELLQQNTTYYLIAINSDGCESLPLTITPNLRACDNEELVFFDGFSPNGDAINETFHIENIDIFYPDYKIEFYNRWGNLLYTGNAAKPEWNGKLKGNGKNLPVGVYYYIVHFNKNGKKPLQKKLYLSR
ncbi:MAG: gliding motility-associated C-terminal domain-containing protein, partial [Winogradskyella sp.]